MSSTAPTKNKRGPRTQSNSLFMEEEGVLSPAWNPYSSRPDWTDVKPIWETKESQAAFAIAYTDSFREINAYMRAILQSGELSKRALELTLDAIIANPANYTAWFLRRKIIRALCKDEFDAPEKNPHIDMFRCIHNEMIAQELNFSAKMACNNPKNYQIWHHRQILLEWLKYVPAEEDQFIRHALIDEPKNYHAWQYRQWLVRFSQIWDREFDYTEQLIENDLRNNSAWSHRFFVFEHELSLLVERDSERELIRSELAFALGWIKKCTNNESAMNYVRGILERTETSICDVQDLFEFFDRSDSTDRLILEFKIMIAKEKCMKNIRDDPKQESSGQYISDAEKTLDTLLKDLISSDPIRQKYWTYVVKSIKQGLVNV